MKIVFLISGSVRSNFSYRALALARGLRKLGNEIVIVAPSADKYNNFTPEAIKMIDGVKILQPYQFATRRVEVNLLPYMFGAARMVLAEKPDVVYIYKPTPITIVGLVAKLFRGTPVVLDMDDLGSDVMKIEGHPWHQRALVAWCEHAAARRADRIVVASTFLYEKYRMKFPQKPLHIMPNGVEANWFAEPVVTDMKARIVFMGAINRKSILDPLFRSLPVIFKRYPAAEALVIGDGKFLAHFKALSKELGIEKNTRFTGWLALDDAKKQLYAGDIGYNYMPSDPTNKAASNMKVPQYMARGVVPIVSDVGDLPATVDFGGAGYIAKPNDLMALESTLLGALADSGRAQKAKHAREFAQKNLDWNVLANAFDQWNMKYQYRNG